MADQILVDYQALDDMAKHCDFAANRLAQTAALAQKISSQMQNGAMVGKHGDVYTAALTMFQGKVAKLSSKYQEVANDIRKAADDMRQADNTAGANF